MRIAIYAPVLGTEQGGASTLERDIFQTMLQHVGGSKHEFLVYTQGVRGLPGQLPPNVRLVELKKERLRKIAFLRLVNGMQDWLFDQRKFTIRSWFEKSLVREGAQVVYYPTNRFEPCDLPYIYTVLDIENLTQPGYPEITENGEFERRRNFYQEIVPKAAYVISANEAGKEQLVRHFHLDPRHVFPLPYVSPPFAREGSDTPKDPSRLQKYNLKREFLYYPAKCYAHKNHVGVVHALKSLRERHGIHLDVVFSGPDGGNKAHVLSVARSLGLEDSVHFVGLAPIEDVVQFYKHAVAMTYMSFFAPTNIPALEAFALGCPVVNALVDGSEEDFGEAAVLVPPADHDALADAVAKIHRDPAHRADLIRRGLARSRKWTMPDYVKAVFALFDRYEKIRRCWA